MQLLSTITNFLALGLTVVQGASIQKRIPILGGFTLSTQEGCPMDYNPNTQHFGIGYGQACGECVPVKFWNNASFKAIDHADINEKCTITLYNKCDCSDPGIVTGPQCWTPEGGIAAYKVECPWWPEGPTWENFKPCYH